MRLTFRLLFIQLTLTALMGCLHAQDQHGADGDWICNRDHSLCVNASVERMVAENPFYFEARVRGAERVVLGWELRDDAGKVLDQDRDGGLAFPIGKGWGDQRILGVRDFGVAPAGSGRGRLLVHAAGLSESGKRRPLPELSLPVQLDRPISRVRYAVPADKAAFSRAVNEAVNAGTAQGAPLRAEIAWRTKTVLHVRPSMAGGAAAEAAARAYPGQGMWHVGSYRLDRDEATAHVTMLGEGWAGVSYYLRGLDFLLERTVEREGGVRQIVFDRGPGPGQ